MAGSGGARVSGEATPHHLSLTDEDVLGLDSNFKMNPPLRTEADRQAVIEGLRSGVIECIATDHAPHDRHEKEMPFELAPMGTTGLETAFASVYTTLVKPGASVSNRAPTNAARDPRLRRPRNQVSRIVPCTANAGTRRADHSAAPNSR